jgi:UDP:flavonoid glycosyltransferase YjiC (YdhE family)
MRVAIQTLGSRGDVQPYLALARELARRGHAVQLAAPAQFEALVAGQHIPFMPLPGEFLALLDTPDGKAAVAGGRGFGAGLRLLRQVRPLMRGLLEAEWAAVRDFRPDVILHHLKSVAAAHMARALGCPSILASPLPGFTPTAAFPSPILSLATLGPLNRASHALAARAAGLLFAGEIRAWRAAWPALAAPRPGAGGPCGTLYAYSPQVVPVPADWGSEVLVSGYWFLDSEGWAPPPALAAFLAAGEMPVYVGFGSMPGLEPRRMLAMVVEALARLGKRGVLASGGGALAAERVPGHVCLIAEAPHDWLFPRVAATVHHGGAGTTGASLRAGRPAAICPFIGDQPFWGRRVAALGAGPRPLDRDALTAEGLAAAIRAMDEPGMRGRAAALGEAIRAERGMLAAARFIEAAVAGRRA